jgi:hypothetical protein
MIITKHGYLFFYLNTYFFVYINTSTHTNFLDVPLLISLELMG